MFRQAVLREYAPAQARFDRRQEARRRRHVRPGRRDGQPRRAQGEVLQVVVGVESQHRQLGDRARPRAGEERGGDDGRVGHRAQPLHPAAGHPGGGRGDRGHDPARAQQLLGAGFVDRVQAQPAGPVGGPAQDPREPGVQGVDVDRHGQLDGAGPARACGGRRPGRRGEFGGHLPGQERLRPGVAQDDGAVVGHGAGRRALHEDPSERRLQGADALARSGGRDAQARGGGLEGAGLGDGLQSGELVGVHEGLLHILKNNALGFTPGRP